MSSTRVLVVGSHAESGFSMINFTRDNFAALNRIEAKFEFIFTKPLTVFSKIIPGFPGSKYLTYLDKFLIFGPYLFILAFIKKVNIVHVLDQSDAIYRMFLMKKYKFVVTVHDLFAIQAANNKIPEVVIGYPGRIYQRVISAGLGKADLLLAISSTTERDIRNLFPKVATMVAHNFLIHENNLVPEYTYEKNVPNFFLIIMNSHWRKDRISSIKVWKKLSSFYEFKNSNLVIVGNALTEDEVSLITTTSISRVSIFENLERREIVELYRGCIGVINISKYEGFGLPLIEANIFGRICIYGGSNAFCEIAGLANIDWEQIEPNLIPQNIFEMLVSVERRRTAYLYAVKNFSTQKYTHILINAYLSLMEVESDSQ